jgi:hypothetical protein
MTNSVEQVSAAFGIVMVFLHRRFAFVLRASGARWRGHEHRFF